MAKRGAPMSQIDLTGDGPEASAPHIDLTQSDDEAAPQQADASQIDLTLSDDEAPAPPARDAALQQVRAEAAEAFKQSRTAAPPNAAPSGAWRAQGDERDCDCERLAGRRVFKNFSAACAHYQFPGSHQVGSYGPKGQGIVRTYSNATPGKDVVLDDGHLFLYRLKDEAVRAQFRVNLERRRDIRVFRKVSSGVVELGLFRVEGFVPAGPGDQIGQFGAEFVRMVRAEAAPKQSRAAAPLETSSKRARTGLGPYRTDGVIRDPAAVKAFLNSVDMGDVATDLPNDSDNFVGEIGSEAHRNFRRAKWEEEDAGLQKHSGQLAKHLTGVSMIVPLANCRRLEDLQDGGCVYDGSFAAYPCPCLSDATRRRKWLHFAHRNAEFYCRKKTLGPGRLSAKDHARGRSAVEGLNQLMHNFRDDCDHSHYDTSAKYFFIYCTCMSKPKMFPAAPHLGMPYASEGPSMCGNSALVVRSDAVTVGGLPLEQQNPEVEEIYHCAVDPTREKYSLL